MHELYAHSRPGRPPEEWQSLADHSHAVARDAAAFAAAFDSSDWAWNAGWLHDLGKAAPEFQKYLIQQNVLDDPRYDDVADGGINHSSAGAALAEQASASRPAGTILAYLVAGHHAGLADFEGARRGSLRCRLEEGRAHLARIEGAAACIGRKLRDQLVPPAFLRGDARGFHLWVRMLFSCLVEADYLDTEAFMQTEGRPPRGGYPTLSELKSRFDRHMESLAAGADPTPVNTIRREILAACRTAAGGTPGLYSLSVPTGGGKTLAGTAFALDHAVAHGLDRIIYVIPYTSIIEQTAHVLSEVFGNENVIEHHSNLAPERETQRMRAAAENWDAPVIVTTNVQFFESLYSDRPSRCRKLHNIANSVVILDEAQLLPTNWLVPCVEALSHLVKGYRTSVLLSTATQPKPPKMSDPVEIIPDPAQIHQSLRRTRLRMPQDLKEPTEWPELAGQLSGHDQVLCIVNSRCDCRELYEALIALKPDGTLHLSALMCGEHRSQRIAEIKARLKSGQSVRVVSTQLVEAGVDLDFPVVYRALAGLDSIWQAAGRCNREGKREALGEVVVFVPPKPPPMGLLRKGADKTVELAGIPGINLENPDATARYFDLFYRSANDLGEDWLNRLLVQDRPNLQFRTAGREFRLIEENSEAVIVLYGESERWIKDLRMIGPTREIMRRLQRYSVSLYPWQLKTMLQDCKLERLDCGIVIQSSPRVYREDIGLDPTANALPPEDLFY